MRNYPDLEYYKNLLALLLADENIKVHDHQYGMGAFGSWHIEYEECRTFFKIRWDAKEGRLMHQLQTNELWLGQYIYKDLSNLNAADVATVKDYWNSLQHP